MDTRERIDVPSEQSAADDIREKAEALKAKRPKLPQKRWVRLVQKQRCFCGGGGIEYDVYRYVDFDSLLKNGDTVRSSEVLPSDYIPDIHRGEWDVSDSNHDEIVNNAKQWSY